ncbi:MAG: hypothetical protein EBS06_05355 [Proteobacteria bacterium]|nr:hypothetical protein [Pseudomonadota bacterium]
MKFIVEFEDLDNAENREELRKFILQMREQHGENMVFNFREAAHNTIWTLQTIDAWHNVMIWKAGTKGRTKKTTLTFFPDSIAARSKGENKNTFYRK